MAVPRAVGARPRAAREAADGGLLPQRARRLSYAELAALLDSSEEAARRNVHEGLKRLKRS